MMIDTLKLTLNENVENAFSNVLPSIQEALDTFVRLQTNEQLCLVFKFETLQGRRQGMNSGTATATTFIQHLCSEYDQCFKIDELGSRVSSVYKDDDVNYNDVKLAEAECISNEDSLKMADAPRRSNRKKRRHLTHRTGKKAMTKKQWKPSENSEELVELSAIVETKTPSSKHQKSLQDITKTRETLHCADCDFETPYKFSLLRHQKAKHCLPGEVTYKCSQCYQMLQSEESLAAHKATVHVEDKEVCSLCGKGYTTKSALRHHVRLKHTNCEAKYRCDVCDKTFEQKFHYQGHLDTHVGVKRHECQHCGMKFSYKTSYYKHKCKSQENKKSFACDQCGLIFAKKTYLNDHVIGKHSGRSPYVCKHCLTPFHWRGSWTNHLNYCKVKKQKAELLKQKRNENIAEPTNSSICESKQVVVGEMTSSKVVAKPILSGLTKFAHSDPVIDTQVSACLPSHLTTDLRQVNTLIEVTALASNISSQQLSDPYTQQGVVHLTLDVLNQPQSGSFITTMSCNTPQLGNNEDRLQRSTTNPYVECEQQFIQL